MAKNFSCQFTFKCNKLKYEYIYKEANKWTFSRIYKIILQWLRATNSFVESIILLFKNCITTKPIYQLPTKKKAQQE